LASAIERQHAALRQYLEDGVVFGVFKGGDNLHRVTPDVGLPGVA